MTANELKELVIERAKGLCEYCKKSCKHIFTTQIKLHIIKNAILCLIFLSIFSTLKAQVITEVEYVDVEKNYTFEQGYIAFQISSQIDKDTVKLFLGNGINAVHLIAKKRYDFSTDAYDETPLLKILDSINSNTINLYPKSNELKVDNSCTFGNTIKENSFLPKPDVKNTGEIKTIKGIKCTKWTVSYEDMGYKYLSEIWLAKDVISDKNIIRLAFSSTTLYTFLVEEFLDQNLFPIEMVLTRITDFDSKQVRIIELLEIDLKATTTINTENYEEEKDK